MLYYIIIIIKSCYTGGSSRSRSVWYQLLAQSKLRNNASTLDRRFYCSMQLIIVNNLLLWPFISSSLHRFQKRHRECEDLLVTVELRAHRVLVDFEGDEHV